MFKVYRWSSSLIILFIICCTLNYLGIRYFALGDEFKGKKDCTKIQSKIQTIPIETHFQAFQDISSLKECKVAAKDLDKKFSHVWTQDSFPKRCHVMRNSNGGDEIVYWNNDKTGGASERSSPICKLSTLIR